jgi:hypothetical protein
MTPVPVDHHHVAALEHRLDAVQLDVAVLAGRHVHPHRRGDRVEVVACGQDQVLEFGHEHRLDQRRRRGIGLPLRATDSRWAFTW